MKNFKYIFSLLLGSILIFSGCGSSSGGEKSGIEYEVYSQSTVSFSDFSMVNQRQESTDFDRGVYYRNDLNLDMADPMVIYIEEENLFYAYGTRDGGGMFAYYTSPDLTVWNYGGECFRAPSGSWIAGKGLWAPDVQKIEDKWYLYFSVPMSSGVQIGVAVGDSPKSFTQYTGINALGQSIQTAGLQFQGMEKATILDQNIFQDDDGKLYMYFSYDTTKYQEEEHAGKYAEIWGVELIDPVTWDLSTLTRLIVPGKQNLGDSEDKIEWEYASPSFTGGFRCAEGPYMIKKNGKYLLTYCANSYVDNQYSVGYAVSTTPLGAYEKPYSESNPYENMLLGVPGGSGTKNESLYKGFQTGTGHASIVEVGDEYMFAYHAHVNRDSWGVKTDYSLYSDRRGGGFDYLYFTDDGTPYTNGPTWSLTRLPEKVSGLKNLALSDGVTLTAECEDSYRLRDNYTSGVFSADRDAKFKKGTKSIEIKFGKTVKVKAVNIYNSAEFETAIREIDQIDFGNGKGVKGIYFNEYHFGRRTVTYGTEEYIYPHTAFTVCLDESILTDRIVITIKSDKDFTLGEIEILGENV